MRVQRNEALTGLNLVNWNDVPSGVGDYEDSHEIYFVRRIADRWIAVGDAADITASVGEVRGAGPARDAVLPLDSLKSARSG